jgi:hypothetical protein
MFANQHRFGRENSATCVVSLLIFLWAFLGTIDGPMVKLEANSGHLLYQLPKIVKAAEHAGAPGALWTDTFHKDPPPLHPSFLLFDFKQNLRRWPNVAGDISRSPPFPSP